MAISRLPRGRSSHFGEGRKLPRHPGRSAVAGALTINLIPDRLGVEKAVSLLAILGGIALIGVGLSRVLVVTCLGLFLVGGATMVTIALTYLCS